MKNLKVRSLNINDEEIFEEFIFEHIVAEVEYLTDSSIVNNKKYINYPNFKEWYKNKKGETYLVLTNKTVVGAFELHDCTDGLAIVALDVKPTERDKGYGKIMLNFIRNLCSLKDIDNVTITTSISYLPLEKESKSDNITNYKLDLKKNKVLIKKY